MTPEGGHRGPKRFSDEREFKPVAVLYWHDWIMHMPESFSTGCIRDLRGFGSFVRAARLEEGQRST